MAIGSTAVWEVRSTATGGANVNGGFYTSGGVDYSQQNGAQYAITTGTSAGAGSVINTALAAADMVGNGLRLVSGTNATPGWYEVISVVVGVSITVDRACTTGAGASIVANVGGAISLGSADDAVFEAMGTGGNTIHVKGNATYTLGGTVSIAAAGGTQNPVMVMGYATVRGDSPTGTTRPILDCGAAAFTFGANWDTKHLQFTGTAANVLISGASNKIRYVKVTNTSVTAGRNALNGAVNSYFFACEAISTVGNAFTSNSTVTVEACYFHSSDIGIACTSTTSGQSYSGCISSGNTTAAFKTTVATTAAMLIDECTFYGAETPAGTGILLTTGTTNIRVTNTIIYGFVTGVSHADVQTVSYENFCSFFNNTTNRTNWPTGVSSIALDPQFTNAPAGDFSVGANMQAAGYPGIFPGGLSTGYKDIGAIQRKERVSTDPGIANVRSGTAYTINDAALTGTLTVPSLANTKTGVAGDGGTGTYDGSDRWTDPAIANVRTGTAYKANSTVNNRTGTAAIPGATDVRSGVATDATVGSLVVPSLANTKTGVAGDGGTGTYDGSDRWTAPAVTDLRSGVQLKNNSTSLNLTGTLVVPSLANTKTGVAGDGGNGTYDGSDRWSDPGIANVTAPVAYKANSTVNNRVGTNAGGGMTGPGGHVKIGSGRGIS